MLRITPISSAALNLSKLNFFRKPIWYIIIFDTDYIPELWASSEPFWQHSFELSHGPFRDEDPRPEKTRSSIGTILSFGASSCLKKIVEFYSFKFIENILNTSSLGLSRGLFSPELEDVCLLKFAWFDRRVDKCCA